MTAAQAKPVIQQVIDILQGKIRGGEFELTGKLPPESLLAQQLHVSRTTLRTALARLEADGLITRRQGNGTFINKRAMEVDTSISKIWDFRCMIEESGRTPSVRKLNLSIRPPTSIEATILELNPDHQVLEIIRLYLANGEPVIYSNNVFPYRFFQPAFAPDEIDVSLPIHILLHSYFDQTISYSLSDISADIPDDSLIGILSISPCSPLLYFHDIFYNDNDEPLMYGRNFYNDKRIRIRMARSWG